MKLALLVVSTFFVAHSLSAVAGVLDSWNSPFLSAAGTYYSTKTSESTDVRDQSKVWLINSWQSECLNNLPGPNLCYAPSSGKLYYHGQKGMNGDGVLLVSKDRMPILNGMIVEGSFRAYCSTNVGGCWVNMGIYSGEGNYRSIGYKSRGNKVAHFSIWGPDSESTFNGGNLVKLRLNQAVHKYKLQYWKKNGTWRWDYFLDNTWVAGHKVPDNEHKLGRGQFNDARIALGYGGYQIDGASAEGYFETITFATW